MVVSLNTRNAKREKTYYNSKFQIYGYDPRSLGWIIGFQETRFKNLAMVGDLNNCSILDVGCGFGDLYGYLLEQGIQVKYTGIDINRNFIRTAKEIYPETQFIEADFEETAIRGRYDWVLASGIFNLKIDNNQAFIENSLKKMYKLCKKGIVADFLNSKDACGCDGLYYPDAGDLLRFSDRLSGHVVIREDYLPTDFCIYIYKDTQDDELIW
jgi:2-polyprenyl-3-methyl-5-hydroxy-6-metoxy-1,4-benzoquinol methylase